MIPGIIRDKYSSVRFFFLFSAVVTAVLGSGLLFFPEDITNIFLNNSVETGGLFFIRFAGTSLLGFSVLNFYVVNKDRSLLGLAALINVSSLAPATVLSFLTYSANYIDKFQWLIVLEHSFFLAGFLISWMQLKSRTKTVRL